MHVPRSMSDPVIVFLLAVACLLVAGAATRPLFERSGVPEALWLVGLGVALRTTGLVPAATVAALAPFFAALALVIVLFEAGRSLRVGAPREEAGRSLRLALAGAAATVPLVALCSMALHGLELLPIWSWTHALMLGALLTCTAPEVFTPSLRAAGVDPAATRVLGRESAITGALAIAGTALCIDLLSLQVAEGGALAAIAAGFGLGLSFGSFAGLLWISAVRLLAEGRRIYPYTLAGVIALYVFTEALGGIGALAVLVFGAIVANAGALVELLYRPRDAEAAPAPRSDEFAAALDEHANTVAIFRVLMFAFIGLGLGPPWGLLVMGVALGLLLVVARLAASRAAVGGLDERAAAALAGSGPRGMAAAALAALPWAAAVPGTQSLTTLVFAATVTTCAAFAAGIRGGQRAAAWAVRPRGVAEETGPAETAGGEPTRPEGHVTNARVYEASEPPPLLEDPARWARPVTGRTPAVGPGGTIITHAPAPVPRGTGESAPEVAPVSEAAVPPTLPERSGDDPEVAPASEAAVPSDLSGGAVKSAAPEVAPMSEPAVSPTLSEWAGVKPRDGE